MCNLEKLGHGRHLALAERLLTDALAVFVVIPVCAIRNEHDDVLLVLIRHSHVVPARQRDRFNYGGVHVVIVRDLIYLAQVAEKQGALTQVSRRTFVKIFTHITIICPTIDERLLRTAREGASACRRRAVGRRSTRVRIIRK